MESYLRAASYDNLNFPPSTNIVVGPVPVGCSGYNSITNQPWAYSPSDCSPNSMLGWVLAADAYARDVSNIAWHGWRVGFRA